MSPNHEPNERRPSSNLEEWAVFFLALIAIWQAFGMFKRHPKMWWLVAFLLFLFYVILPLFDHTANGLTDF